MSEKNSRMRIVKHTLSALWWCVLIALFALVICILGAKMRGEVPKIFGYSVLHIVSGSMEPDIPTGAFILIRECDPEDVQVGDIISFYSDDPKIQGYLNTHRVVQTPYVGDRGLLFTTKGDAVVGEDPVPARAEALVGKYVKTLDTLTSFSDFLSRTSVIPVMLLILTAGTVVLFIAAAKVTQAQTKTDAKEDLHENDDQA